MVKIKNTIEKTFTHSCTVINKQSVRKEDMSTAFEDVVIVQNQPCRLSYSNISTAKDVGVHNESIQQIKLFLNNSLNIPPGSVITVIHDGVTDVYSNSGKSSVFSTHQEIVLELKEGV